MRDPFSLKVLGGSYSALFLTLMAGAAPAWAGWDINVAVAEISGGKVVVSGTTTPNTLVQLDGQAAPAFNVRAAADGSFSFSLAFHPGDCIVDLQRRLSPASLGPVTEAVVAGCAPRALAQRGAWEAKAQYLAEDIVTVDGGSWRARRANVGKLPGAGSSDWQPFAGSQVQAVADVGQGAGTQPSDGGVQPMVAPTGPAGGALTGSYPNPEIANNAVTTAKIADLAITTVKIAAGAVTGSRIADSTITGEQIAPLAIGVGRIANNAVTGAKIVDGTITTEDIGDGAVGSADVSDESLTQNDLATNSVGAAEVTDDTLTQADLAVGSVGSLEIATDAVQASDIADSSIDGGEIIDGSIGAVDLASSSVGSSEIATSAVGSAEVASNSLTTADIAGTNSSGAISITAGAVANGRCRSFNIAVGGALAGDLIVISTRASLPAGLLIYGQQAPVDGKGVMTICNLSGAAMPALTDFPIRTVTWR